MESVSPQFSVKNLGSFTEQDVNFSMVRFDADAALEFGKERTQLLFTLDGDIEADGETYPAQTAVWSSFGEADRITGRTGATAVVFGFPKDETTEGVRCAPYPVPA
ncbi:hypothetical protein BJF78_06710 [Pseudonocardia sp. CNS-139]|nr:hypothetical protein BJF78_06710 [Pseudonocardia sp. CNS-139]